MTNYERDYDNWLFEPYDYSDKDDIEEYEPDIDQDREYYSEYLGGE